MSLLTPRATYKPFQYPWAYDAWQEQQQVHWMPREVPLADDVKDWNTVLSDKERNLVTQIFRFFTQSDVEVNNCYMRHYLRVFKPAEVQMMLVAFSNMETIHVDAYSQLLDTLGMPEVEYSAFLQYKEMREKHEYLDSFNPDTPLELAETMATFAAFVEGMALFASFAILFNFTRFNKLKGMGQIVTWSVRDETLHCNSILHLYHTFLHEHPEIDRDELSRRVTNRCIDLVSHEDAFIDLAFAMGDIEGLTADEVKRFIRYIANGRCKQLGITPIYPQEPNPLPWMDPIMNGIEHANFFENRATDYSRAASSGEWSEVFDELDERLEIAAE